MGIEDLKFENVKRILDSDFESGWIIMNEMADCENEEAMIFIADCYYKGNYVEMDESLAYELFNKIVLRYPENGAIWGKIGDCHFYGYGVPKSHQESIHIYEEACKHGHVKSVSDIGWIYAFGDIEHNNEQLATKWFQLAADKGDATGKYYMGFFYHEGIGGLPKNQKLAHQYLSEAAAGNNYLALRYLLRERCFGNEKEFTIILNRMNQLAEEGDSNVQYDLGFSYLCGLGVEKDNKKAFQFLQKAADAGNEDAMFKLGKLLIDCSDDFPYDYETGHKYLLAVAETGNLEAAYELYRYYRFQFHSTNIEKAMYWAEKIVEGGQRTFLREDIASFYFNDGDIIDHEKAIMYYEAILEDEDNRDTYASEVFFPLALCYLKQGGENTDYTRVMWLLEQAKTLSQKDDDSYNAAKRGEILYWIAYMNEHGLGKKKNLDIAHTLYLESAEYGYEKSAIEAQKFKKSLFGWKKD